MREFATGATRDQDEAKIDFEGHLDYRVVQAYCEYMNRHRLQPDGKVRASDNWKLGIPKAAYMKSGWRHFMDWWTEHNGGKSREGMKDALCALLFNVQGYLLEVLKDETTKENPPT